MLLKTYKVQAIKKKHHEQSSLFLVYLNNIHQHLVNDCQLIPLPLEPIQIAFPKWFNKNTKCMYHARIIGVLINHYCNLRSRLTICFGMDDYHLKRKVVNIS